ncbi:Transposase DDE domain-containing protein [Stigmatella erecta]|uniref:Transposase DDE domain-containing protein n=1 Tax=Stigmatella erecta TaxID=83460 RepID=A0A1I0A191_9BACT|nr:Transposase DDE domain-containing protein [Stigmatella erecta]
MDERADHEHLGTMFRELASDALWERVVSLLPVPKKKELGRGPPRASGRAALEAIIFVLRTGIPWEMLPVKHFGLSGMTAWRRLEQWTRAGVFEQLQRHADKAYASRKNRRGLRRRGITPRIARPGIEPKQRLGRHRWVVERTNAWLHQQRRLRVRDERRDNVHFALLVLGCCLILFRGLQTFGGLIRGTCSPIYPHHSSIQSSAFTALNRDSNRVRVSASRLSGGLLTKREATA